MRTTIPYLIIIVVWAGLIVLTGYTTADLPVNQTSEIQGISTSTGINSQGTVTESDSLAWQLDSESLHDPPLNSGGFFAVWYDANGNPVYGWTADPLVAALLGEPVPHGEVRYTAGYNANSMAVQGVTTLTKTVGISTANQIADSSNLNIDTSLQYTANDTGRATSSEDLLLDGAGAHTTASDKILCPFVAASVDSFIPPFCNIVDSGSSIDVTSASVVTSDSERFIAATADIPVTQSYTISGTGATPNTPAIGSMSAIIKAHLQEGQMFNVTPNNPEAMFSPSLYVPGKVSDISYSESSTASGLISTFAKSMSYQSGINLI